jgi:microsomal dipeptidase-like Zn-dependent dipeptidase
MNHTSPLWSLLLCFSTHNRKTVLIRHLMVAVVLFLSVYQTLFAQAVAFLARTNNANVTPVGHTATDGKPKALVFIQQTHQNLSPGKSSANCGYPVGVSYKSGKWNLECLLADAAIPDATLFNIMVVPTASACAFKHTVTQSGQSTPLDNPLINGNPNATLVITQDFTNGVRNAKFVGVKYENSRWHILNEDGSTIPAKTQFNVFVADKGFTHIITTTNSHPSWPSTSIIRNAATDSKKDIFLFVTHRYKSKYIPSNLSVWYENVNWHGFVTTGPAIKDYAGEEMSGYVFSPQNSCAMPLRGWVDMHTHPMSHLGFGRKAMHGAPGLGCIIPAGTHNCNRDEFRATSIDQALGNCNSTHGGWGTDNDCGDYIRAGIINYALDDKFEHKSDNPHGDHHHAGYPALSFWPNHTSILHQQMWSDWIRRARDGGLRVMVALTVNSELLAEIINGDGPYDDKTVADIQIDETVRFVNNNRSFMEIAYSKADLERIVRANKIAVVLGMEVDKIGNFGKSGVVTNEATVRAEIQRLYNKGIRYVFPIHLVDNSFGGAAVYEMLFNFANKHANGRHFSVTTSSDPNVQYRANATDGPLGLENGLILGMRGFLEGLGQIPAPCFNDAIKCFPPPGKVRCCGSFERILGILSPAAEFDAYKFVSGGHVNSNGLTPLGEAAIDEMMKLGMMIDIDHMSERSMTRTIELAERRSGGYPLNMGHNGIRGPGGNERGAPIAFRSATINTRGRD